MPNIKTRITNKHDTEANWALAENFRPLAGEVIVYDVDSNHAYPRFKVGDGTTLVSALPFSTDILTSYVTETELASALNATASAINKNITTIDDEVATHIAAINNPHQVTKSQIGLSNVDNVKQYSASNPPPYGTLTFTGAVEDSFTANTSKTIKIPTIAGPVGPTGATGPQGETGTEALVYKALGQTSRVPTTGNISLNVSGFNRTPIAGETFVRYVQGISGIAGRMWFEFCTALGTFTAGTLADVTVDNVIEITGEQGATGAIALSRQGYSSASVPTVNSSYNFGAQSLFNRIPTINDIFICTWLQSSSGRSWLVTCRVTSSLTDEVTATILSVAETTGEQGVQGPDVVVKTAAEWASDNTVLEAGQFGYDSTNKITKIGDGITAWANLPLFITSEIDMDFATLSWHTINQLSQEGLADKYFSVGEEKTIELTTGEKVTLVILGFNHDDLTGGGKAGISIGMKNLLATKYRMNASNTNVGGWDESEMRTSTMATLLSQLPSDLQSVIKQVNKKATAGGNSMSITTSADKLWLFAEVEIDGATWAGYADEGEQYEYWKTVKDGTVTANRIKYSSNGSGSADFWWLRSPSVSDSAGFRGVDTTGNINSYSANYARGVSFGFCV